MVEGAGDAAHELYPEIAEAYSKHATALHRVSYAVLFDRGLQAWSSDIVNTAILEVLEHPPVGVQNWEAYLVTIVRRRALDFVRSAAVRHRNGSEVDLNAYPDEADRIEEVGDGVDILAQMVKAVDALNALESSSRRIAYEYFWLERKQSDVASDLGITQARVSQVIATARKQLKDHIEGGAL